MQSTQTALKDIKCGWHLSVDNNCFVCINRIKTYHGMNNNKIHVSLIILYDRHK